MEPNRNSGKVEPEAAASDHVRKSIGLYIHIPFCEKKCFYCDFYSVENQSRRNEFVSSLIKEIELSSTNRTEHCKADTIFFGGGTPSLLSPAEIDSILKALQNHFAISSDAEFTMECNPGTVSLESLSGYQQLGVNRLSFGVQSFFDDELRFLSRIHDSQQAIEAIVLARRCGFDNTNLDLIHGLPGQTPERVLANLATAVELNPDHISAYNLIVEPGTPLFTSVAAGEVRPLEELAEAKMFKLTMSFLEKNGYEHYEISNYSRPGFQCRHNLKYWNCEEYLSFGPSAHSYFNGTRWWNVASLSNYLAELSADRLPISAKEVLTKAQLADEFVMLQLRQGKIDLTILHDRFKIKLAQEFMADLEKEDYARVSRNKIFLTKKGFAVCDKIVEDILAGEYDESV
jgi:oxygen-independent coproporphyrinogen-3 oxidase